MKVLHVLSEKSWRGGEQQAAYLIDYCKQHSVSSHVACRHDSAFEAYCIKQKIPYLALPFKNQFDLYTIFRIRNYCRRHKVDAIHLHTANAHGVGVLSHLFGARVALFVTRRVMFPIKDNWFSHFKYNYHAIKRIFCVSNAVRKLVSSAVKDKDKCSTVYDGINIEKFNHKPSNSLRRVHQLSDKTKLIGNIAALEFDKDLYTFIDAAKIILDKGEQAKFFIFGAGSAEPAIRDHIASKRMTDHIILTGFVIDINEIIPQLDVVVMTSRTEGLGSSLLEAIASRVPVVASNTGGIPEIVINAETGLLAPIADSQAFAMQILNVINNHSLRELIIQQAHQHLLKNFTLEKMGEDILNDYQQCGLISVVITTYNRPEALEMVLHALAKQSDLQFEVLVADDGSRVETKKLISNLSNELPFPMHHVWQEDDGFKAAMIRNKAVAQSKGDYIIFLDGDCIPPQTFISRHRDLAENKYFVAGNRLLLSQKFTETAVAHQWDLFNKSILYWFSRRLGGDCNRLIPMIHFPLHILRKLHANAWRGIKTCNLAVWRHDFMAINGFDESYVGWGYEDSDLVIRLLNRGISYKSGRCAVPVIHLWHQENDRSQEHKNFAQLQALLETKRSDTEVGIKQYLV